jgi:hypothetical protein
MAFSEADLAAVEAALAKGEAYVMFADRAVSYRSVADLERVRDRIKDELAAASGAARPKQTLIVATKGL